MSTRFSPSRSPASMRIQLASASRLRSSSLKKPPEPLRRAIADCLSSSALSHHGSPSAGASEASRTLRVRILLISQLFICFYPDLRVYIACAWFKFTLYLEFNHACATVDLHSYIRLHAANCIRI